MIPNGYVVSDCEFLKEVAQRVMVAQPKAKRRKLAGSKPRKEQRQADFNAVMAGCAFLRHCQDDAKELPEPQWWAMVSIIARCEDGREHVHKLSAAYPSYSPEETDSKVDQSLKNGGPHFCATIERDHGDFCAGCPHRDKISSPIVLGNKHQGIDPAIAAINRTYAVVPTKNSVCILRERIDLLTMFKTFDLLSRESFKLDLANKGTGIIHVDGKPKAVPLSEAWLKSPFRREFPGGIVFDPTMKTDLAGCYNLYQGLAVKPKQGDWSLFREHILIGIADGDQAVFEYLLAWIADLIQHPAGPRPGTAVVLLGKQGTGKGFFVNGIGRLLGPHFISITDSVHLTGRFNGHLAGCLLCFVDEGIWAGDHASAGVLKARITEPTMLYEAKGKDPFPIANYSRFIIASNNSWVVPAGLEERRFLVLTVSDKHRRDYEYFAAIEDQLENGGYEAMLYDLLNVDLSKLNLREIPRTKSLLDQIFHSLPPVQKYWLDCLHRGGGFSAAPSGSYQEDCHWGFESQDTSVLPRTLYADYLAWIHAAKVRHPGTEDSFYKDIRKLCDIKRVQRSRGLGPRQWFYQIPTLDECRKQFEKQVGINVAWHDREEVVEDFNYYGLPGPENDIPPLTISNDTGDLSLNTVFHRLRN